MRRQGWLCFAFCCFAVAFASRRPEQITQNQFWGDDGYVFFAQAVAVGPAAIWQPSQGYLHLVPRLVAFALSWVPWPWVPLAYNIAGFLLLAGVATRVAGARLPPVAAWSGALALVAVPFGGEVYGNLCCLHFPLAILVLVNLLEPAPQTGRETARRAAEVAVAVLSGPSAVLLAIGSVFRCFAWRRVRLGLWLLGALGAAAIAQILVMAHSSRTIAGWPAWLPALRIVLPTYARILFANWLGWGFGATAGWVALAGLAPAVVLMFRDRDQRHRPQAIAVLAGACGLLLLGRLTSVGWPNPYGGGERYVYLPFALVFWAFGWLAAGSTNRAPRLLAALAMAAIAASAGRHWRPPPWPDYDWAGQVAEARAGTRERFVTPGVPPFTFPVPRPRGEPPPAGPDGR